MRLVDTVMPSVSCLDEVKLRQAQEVGAGKEDNTQAPAHASKQGSLSKT